VCACIYNVCVCVCVRALAHVFMKVRWTFLLHLCIYCLLMLNYLHELNVLDVHYTIMNLLFCIFETVHGTVWDRKSSCLCVLNVEHGEEASN
jgi:hypothetical protein